MTEIIEVEVSYISSMSEPLSYSRRKATSVSGKGHSLSLETAVSVVTALSLNGTHLDEPFLVMGRKIVFLSRSMCSQRNPGISPRRIAVFIARANTGQRYQDRDFSAAILSLSNSSSFSLSTLDGLLGRLYLLYCLINIFII